MCPCPCDYSRDATCTCRDLAGPVSITVTKSAVSLLYPLTYARTVNYSPIEKAVYKQDCRDGGLDDTPTCGWYLLDGQRVEDSQVWACRAQSTGQKPAIADDEPPGHTRACMQGFCCSCSSGQIWQDTLGDARQTTRAGLNCDYFADPFLPVFGKPPGSAHCLVYQPSWCAPPAAA